MRTRWIMTALIAAGAIVTSAGLGVASPRGLNAGSEPEGSISVTLLDPVPTLLSGSQVTANYNTLATQGRAVQGVDADGVTEMVVRWPATAAGLQFTAVLLNDQGKRSSSANNDGALAQIGSTVFNESQLTVTSVNTSAGPMGFFLYRAPVDFPRPSGQDANSSSRTVSLRVVEDSTTSNTTVTILRPPVILVHGLWGQPSDWDTFTPFISDARFEEFRADYSQSIGADLSSYTPSYPTGDQGTITALATGASLGFSYNGPTVLNEVASDVSSFDNGVNPAGIAVAGVQADFVDHSMGGDVTRWLVQESNFLSNDTFAQGSIHKVVTIGTPHLGSPLATDLLANNNSCVRTTIALEGDITFDTATVSGTNTTGAMNDLQGDGFGGSLSAALTTLSHTSPHPVPVALIYGLVSQSQLNGLNTSIDAILLRILCAGDPLASHLTAKGWPQLFGQSSDAVVPEVSAVNNLSNGVAINGVVHSSALSVLGFGAPYELDQSSGIPSEVVNLLNTTVTNSIYDRF
jgi:hypothetical protein